MLVYNELFRILLRDKKGPEKSALVRRTPVVLVLLARQWLLEAWAVPMWGCVVV